MVVFSLKEGVLVHELSLIHGLLATVAESAAARGITRVTRVRLVVGARYKALPEELQFSFGMLTKDTVCDGAELEIVAAPGDELCVDFYEGE